MVTEFWEVVCDENCIGGTGENCGDNDAQLGRMDVFFTRPRAASICSARSSSNTSPV
jgi:hypothetical protein